MSWRSSLSKNIQELRVHLCQTSKGSQGVRDFVGNHYLKIKAANPNLKFMVREASGVEARLFARYPYGVERKISLENLTETDVEKKLQTLAESAPPPKPQAQ
ncbi:ndufa2, NADH:ubiquinone oxidoreductase 10.5kD subunit [Quaeritorhiza haematococci]|nr:ndufa2, NADH:ubiquinone oxidoreductase 10.5kD subunit [Quaeritorhiza haematococci]